MTLDTAPSKTPGPADEQRTVRVTHPFHPWHGREFVFVALRHTWGDDRVFFLDGDAVLKSLPTAWTDAAATDVFVAMAAARSPFRAEDLVALAAMVTRAREGRGIGGV